MENASKALIIAGAILLAILIIGLGVFIYNQASNTVSDTGMDQVAIRQFNGQFEPYINKTVDSTAAKALIDTVNQSNKLGKSRIELPDIANKSEIKIGHKYTTEARYSEGVISVIEIIDTNASTIIDDGDEDEIVENVEEINNLFLPYIGDGNPGQMVIDLYYVIEDYNKTLSDQSKKVYYEQDWSLEPNGSYRAGNVIPDEDHIFIDSKYRIYVYSYDENNRINRIDIVYLPPSSGEIK